MRRYRPNRKTSVCLSLLGMLVSVGAVVSVANPASAVTTPVTSAGWSGYVATGQPPYTSVSASWTVPKANCGTLFSGFVAGSDEASWVGIDGWPPSRTVEQIGTDTNCILGQGAYWSWWEMFPALPNIINLNVGPGDNMTASVQSLGKGNFDLVIRDTTRNWTFSKTQTLVSATLGSAECIVEQPAVLSFPLTNFGTESFTGCTVNGAAIGNLKNDQVSMNNGRLQAQASALVNGSNFTVTWVHS